MTLLADLLVGLVPSAGLALPFVRSMVEAGMTGDAIQAALPDLMGGMRRSDMFTLIRRIKDIADTGPMLGSVRNDRRPDPSRLPEPITRTLRTYSFQVRLSGRDAETGERRDEFVTISSNTLLTAGEIKALAISMVPALESEAGRGYYLVGLEDAGAVVEHGTRQL